MLLGGDDKKMFTVLTNNEWEIPPHATDLGGKNRENENGFPGRFSHHS